MTITLRPVIAISARSKLMVTVVGDLTDLLLEPVTTVLSPANAFNAITSKKVSFRELEFVFGIDIAVNTTLTISVGTFSLSSTSAPGSQSIEAAILDEYNTVLAPSSTGSYPAIFSTIISGSSVMLSSFVAQAPDVSVTLTFFAPQSVTMIKVSGLGFIAYADSTVSRRLLQNGISCSNLQYSVQNAPSVNYNALDGELTVKFPGGNANILNAGLPCVCAISGFRNPAASRASFGVMMTTYAQDFIGHGVEGGIIFPPILCAPGFLQIVVGDAVDCVACPKGTYSDTPGASKCTLCPSGTFSSTVAGASPNVCLPCPVGTFSNNTGAADESSCSFCVPGTNSSLLGSLSCALCTPGTYTDSFKQQFCSLCRAGTYGLQSGASSNTMCKSCAAGTYSLAGSTVCQRCPPGTNSTEGSPICVKCAKGTYSDIGGDCYECPSITYSLGEGSTSLYDCSGIRVYIGGNEVAYNIGLCILILYILSFSFVPAWSAKDTVIRFQLTANFEGRLKKSANRPSSKRMRSSSWIERISSRLSKTSIVDTEAQIAIEKRFFEVGDSVVWEDHISDGSIGVVESTSVYPEQDADEFGDFAVFIKMEPSFMASLKSLSQTVQQETGSKPVLIDSRNHGCRCQLLQVPQSHARMPIFGFQLGRWEMVRQISACFQLLLLSFFPAVDTISDLVYILSSTFANFYLFAASVVCITAQFWVFVTRLKKRRVFEAFMQRRVELTYLKGLSWWPKWAAPDSLPVFLTLILPFYFIYHVVFPILWFFVGYIVYSFQLFPISRISNQWLYMFVYSFAVEKDSYRRRFDTSDAIILPMVQKGKVEETILESIPQMVIQLLNAYFLNEIANMPPFTIFSVSLSALSLSNTIWYYAYWNVFRCKPIRDVPSSLSLYNYKLSGVKDGKFSFGKPSHDVNDFEISDRDKMLSITIGDTVLNDNCKSSGMVSDDENLVLPKKAVSAGNLEIEIVRPYVRPDEDDPEAKNAVDTAVTNPIPFGLEEAGNEINLFHEGAGVNLAAESAGNCSSLAQLQTELLQARRMILRLQSEKMSMSEEVDKMKGELLRLSAFPRDSIAVSTLTDIAPNRRIMLKRVSDDDSFEMVRIFSISYSFYFS